jgi:hypothetical protein
MCQGRIPNVWDRPREEMDVEEARPQNAPPWMNFAMDPERWTEMAYSSLGGSKAAFELLQRRRVRLALNRVDLICGLSDELRDKVQATAEFETMRLDATLASLISDAPRNPTQEQYRMFWNGIQKWIEPYRSLGIAPAGQSVNRPRTLWQKVLQSHLSPAQQKALQVDEAKRNVMIRATHSLEVILRLSRRLGLTARQRVSLEAYGRANPDAWSSLEMAWATLQSFPEEEKRKLLRPAQIEQLRSNLETSNDLQAVMVLGVE